MIAVWGLFTRLRPHFVLWGVWLLTLGVVFSVTSTINAYYTAALSPAIAAIIGAGVALLWAERASWRPRVGAAVVVAGTVAYAAWLVPATGSGSGTNVPGWLVPVVIVVGAIAVALLVLSALPARSLAPGGAVVVPAALIGALAAGLLAPAVASGELVAAHRGAFDTPFEPAAEATSIDGLFVALPAQVNTTIAQLTADKRGAPYLLATQTAAVASVFIFASGQEALPIGGFTGTIPSPTLAQLKTDIRQGKFHLVLAATSNDPRLVWIATHCLHLPAVTASWHGYYCVRTDAG